jgi:hypothetical protein
MANHSCEFDETEAADTTVGKNFLVVKPVKEVAHSPFHIFCVAARIELFTVCFVGGGCN